MLSALTVAIFQGVARRNAHFQEVWVAGKLLPAVHAASVLMGLCRGRADEERGGEVQGMRPVVGLIELKPQITEQNPQLGIEVAMGDGELVNRFR